MRCCVLFSKHSILEFSFETYACFDINDNFNNYESTGMLPLVPKNNEQFNFFLIYKKHIK